MSAERKRAEGRDLLFYDGSCGLCHHTVKFVLIRDREGTRFCYAPILGSTFTLTFPESQRAGFPDSIVVKTDDGRTLVRSAAVLEIGERLGGIWRTLARIFGVLPRWLLDWVYDGVAKVRKRIFAPPAGACPLLPPELRGRFLP